MQTIDSLLTLNGQNNKLSIRIISPTFEHLPPEIYKNLKLVEKIKTLAIEKGYTLAQLAIAWVLAQGDDIISIPRSKCINHVEENIASEQVKLTREDLQSIEAIMPAGIVSGTRYSERFMNALGR